MTPATARLDELTLLGVVHVDPATSLASAARALYGTGLGVLAPPTPVVPLGIALAAVLGGPPWLSALRVALHIERWTQ
jgi:hypothetical protein